MRTILVPTEQHNLMNSVLETSLLLAKSFDSYVEGFALRPLIVEVYADVMGAMPLTARGELNDDDAKIVDQSRAVFTSFMEQRGVKRSAGTAPALSFDWTDQAADGDGFVGSYARIFDITVLGRPGNSSESPRAATLEAALFESGRPILIAPPQAPQKMGQNVLVAWNGSTEQSSAIAHAMPILRKAEKVTVLSVEGSSVPGPDGELVANYLVRNGIPAVHMKAEAPNAKAAGHVILSKAAALGCDLLVKGAYTQSRLRQMIFGGTTRHILEDATIPVLMAH
jgi:nucleotide-binding universal stress UspA family protein